MLKSVMFHRIDIKKQKKPAQTISIDPDH